MPDPQCPKCEANALNHMKSRKSYEKSDDGEAVYRIVYCHQCGSIYGVIPNPVSIPRESPS